MAAELKQKVLELFSRENGPFSVHEIMERLETSSNALVNVAIFELVRQEVIMQDSDMPPKWVTVKNSSHPPTVQTPDQTAETADMSITNDGM